MDEWQEVPFSEAVLINPPIRLKNSENYPFVDMASVEPSSKLVFAKEERKFTGGGSRFQSGDTLMARITPCLENGKIGQFYSDNPTIIAHGSTEFIVIRGRPTVSETEFAYYLTKWEHVRSYAIGQMTGTSGRQRVPVNAFDQLLVPIPSVEEQRAIVSVLSALDDKINLNRRINETLEAMARAIFKDWFVDFGPVRAKVEGRPPYLAPELWALFPDAFDDEDKPVGWSAGKLGEYMVNFDSKRVPVSSAERAKRQGSYPYHGATGVMDYVNGYLFDGIYLLVGEDGSVVKESGLAFTQYVWGKFWVNNHAHVLRGKGSVSTEQLLMYFQHEVVTPYITGAVQLKLSQGRMNSMPFIYAGDKICKNFSDVVAPIFSGVRRNSEENKTLAQLRDLLLPKLMSGEIRLRDAEKMVEAVA